MRKRQAYIRIIFSIAYCIMLFFGLRLAFENYFFEDELPACYKLAIAFFSGIVAFALFFLLKNKTIKMYIIVAVAIVIGILFFNWIARY